MQTIREQVLAAIWEKGPITVQALREYLKHLNRKSVKSYVFHLQRENLVKKSPIGWMFGKSKPNPKISSSTGYIDIVPLKQNGWEYHQESNFQYGKWKCPKFGIWHDTQKALELQEERDKKRVRRASKKRAKKE